MDRAWSARLREVTNAMQGVFVPQHSAHTWFLTLNHLEQTTHRLWSATSPYVTTIQVAFLPELV